MRSLTYVNLVVVISLLGVDLSNAYNWASGSNGQVMYALGCDFYGNDISSQPSSGADCGGICAANNNCDHFTWYNGVCYLKRAVNPPTKDLGGGVCGWVTSRPSNSGGGSGGGGSSGGGQPGRTTRYWDCCKVSCAWTANAPGGQNVKSCNKDGNSIADKNAQSGCGGGSSYSCSNNQPITINNNLAYGFAAFSKPGSCCQCYQLTFTSTSIAGKQMIVQVTNTGSDVGEGHFDLQIPGGGVGIFNGCSSQWGAPSGGWGAQYGGVSSASQCSQLPGQLQGGCNWRFGWFQGADNPTVNYQKVACPSQLTSISGCSA